MKIQSLIINDNNILYEVFFEISHELNYSVSKFSKKDLLKISSVKDFNYLILTKKEIPNIKNQILINNFPINIFKLLERINVEFLRLKFNNQSNLKIGNYVFNMNSKEMKNAELNLRLTEKEISSIIYLFNAKKPIKANELQLNVWGYHSNLETHTVETHIYRLRKKILKKFNDSNFINSTVDGYQIK